MKKILLNLSSLFTAVLLLTGVAAADSYEEPLCCLSWRRNETLEGGVSAQRFEEVVLADPAGDRFIRRQRNGNCIFNSYCSGRNNRRSHLVHFNYERVRAA